MQPEIDQTVRDDPTSLSDPRVPVDLFLSPAAGELFDLVFAEVGAKISSLKPVQVRYVPERSVVVQYKAELGWGNHESTETLVAASGLDVPSSTPIVELDQTPVAVWRYPKDPFLPGLEAASDPSRVNKLLADLGSPQSDTKLRRRAYRPGRRAVIEAVSPTARIFIKVVKPGQVAGLQAKHVILADHVPVPRSYGWSEDLGLIALQAMSGKTLRHVLESGSRRLPDPAQIISLLDSFPTRITNETPVQGPVASAPSHARLLKTIAPDSAAEVDEIVETIGRTEDENPTSVHGDFHSAQILVQGTNIVGLVDVDTAGVGQRTDDLASLLGHLATLALTSSKRKSMIDYAAVLLSEFDKQANPKEIRLRTAGVILGLATGPFRVQRSAWLPATNRRIGLARRWADPSSTLP